MSLILDKNTITKYDKPGPRYTSYPTAPEWSKDVTSANYIEKLADFAKTDKTLSVYVHIPFCETLCYFCACMMNIRKNEDKYGNEYLEYLFKEIDLVTKHIGTNRKVRQLHWGGGTPSFLTENQIERLFGKLDDSFDIDYEGEIAIEVDPRRISENKVKTLRQVGFNRISIGLQDFNKDVQQAVNRIQPYELVKQFYQWCRNEKFDSINFDLIYGLPQQTKQTFEETVNQVIGLKPDRIAFYSFAYVPWLKKHQNKIALETLPSPDEKMDIFLLARDCFVQGGYEAIAMDHFALKDDEMAKSFRKGSLHRNFMGYTLKPADEYLGFGVSSIGFLQDAYFHNYKTIPEYYRFLREGDLPMQSGKILSQDDKIRRWTINCLMCRFHINKTEFTQMFNRDFDEYFSGESKHISECINEGLLAPQNEGLQVTELGKIFIRNICMGFDWYLKRINSHQRFSRTV